MAGYGCGRRLSLGEERGAPCVEKASRVLAAHQRVAAILVAVITRTPVVQNVPRKGTLRSDVGGTVYAVVCIQPPCICSVRSTAHAPRCAAPSNRRSMRDIGPPRRPHRKCGRVTLLSSI